MPITYCPVQTVQVGDQLWQHRCPYCNRPQVTDRPALLRRCRGPIPAEQPPRQDCPVVSTQEPDGRWKHWCPQCGRTVIANRPELRQNCQRRPRGPCRFLLEASGQVPCQTCGGTIMIATHGCSVHGQCSPQRTTPGLPFCGTCPDHRAINPHEDAPLRMDEPPDVVLLGYPGDVGGASTEAWHTIKLWRRDKLRVVAIPTWGRHGVWEAKVEATGALTLPVSEANLERVPGLAGAPVVGFCNEHFLRLAPRLRAIGCKLVWVNCMNWLFEAERKYYDEFGPFDAYVFQSQFQLETLGKELAQYGASDTQFHLIHGAFDWGEFPFRPSHRQPGQPLVVGKLARADLDKWPTNLWSIFGSIGEHVRAEVLGFSPQLTEKCGPTPAWAQAHAVGALPAADFYRRLHVLIPVNGEAKENWPRVGLEAMSSGVPIVAPNRWGWREMIQHGQTGFLANTEQELVEYARRLEADESLRLSMAIKARKHLERSLAHPDPFMAGWRRVLEALKTQGSDQHDGGA